MTFLLRKNVEISSAAREKLLKDLRKSTDSSQITVLLYVIKSTKKSRFGEILSEKYDFFGWGAHWKSDVPKEAIWEIDERKFVIQDGRWEQNERLTLDVADGQFQIAPSKMGNES